MPFHAAYHNTSLSNANLYHKASFKSLRNYYSQVKTDSAPKHSKKRVGAYLLFLQFSDTSRSNDEEPVHHTAADL